MSEPLPVSVPNVDKIVIDPSAPTRKKLEDRITALTNELNALTEALNILNSNPEFEKMHDTLTRAVRFL